MGKNFLSCFPVFSADMIMEKPPDELEKQQD
jgi:hypothetical protein